MSTLHNAPIRRSCSVRGFVEENNGEPFFDDRRTRTIGMNESRSNALYVAGVRGRGEQREIAGSPMRATRNDKWTPARELRYRGAIKAAYKIVFSVARVREMIFRDVWRFLAVAHEYHAQH